MRTGLITGTLQTGFIASRPSDRAIPLAAVSFALAIPLRSGRAYGDRPLNMNFGEPMPYARPDPILRDGKLVLSTEPPRHHVPVLDFYIGLDLGLIVPLGDTGNALSLDLGGAVPVRAHKLLLSASAADSQTAD